MAITDPEFQKALSLKSLFDSQGWKVYEEELKGLLEFEKAFIENLSNNFLSQDQVNNLNYHLGKRKMIEMVLSIKDELVGENSPEEEGAKENSED